MFARLLAGILVCASTSAFAVDKPDVLQGTFCKTEAQAVAFAKAQIANHASNPNLRSFEAVRVITMETAQRTKALEGCFSAEVTLPANTYKKIPIQRGMHLVGNVLGSYEIAPVAVPKHCGNSVCYRSKVRALVTKERVKRLPPELMHHYKS